MNRADSVPERARSLSANLASIAAPEPLATELEFLASDLLADRRGLLPTEVHFFNALTLTLEALRLRVPTYTRRLAPRSTSYSAVLEHVMIVLACAALGNPARTALAQAWLAEAAKACDEVRPHFLRRHLGDLRAGRIPDDLRTTIRDTRSRFEHLDEDDGPFAPEVFPFAAATPEEWAPCLPGSAAPAEPDLLPEIADLVVEIAVAC